MAGLSNPSAYGTRLNATGYTCITSAQAQIIGIASYGSATAGIQFFAGLTCSTSMTPMITFSATTSAVAGGLSPMYFAFPMMCSGSGLTVGLLASADPNLTLFWLPIAGS
jgi:hypothetical protein